MKKITLPEINNHFEVEGDTIVTPELAYEIATAERKNSDSISLET